MCLGIDLLYLIVESYCWGCPAQDEVGVVSPVMTHESASLTLLWFIFFKRNFGVVNVDNVMCCRATWQKGGQTCWLARPAGV